VRSVDIENETLKIGKPIDWDVATQGQPCGALSVHVCKGSGDLPMMISRWHPEPEDLEVLNRGGSIYLGIYGRTHPVVTVYAAKSDTSAG
jgi:hypothetical protein